jgi:hypothetical protein
LDPALLLLHVLALRLPAFPTRMGIHCHGRPYEPFFAGATTAVRVVAEIKSFIC